MLSDEALLEAWREGDQSAGSELLQRYFKPLFNFFSTKVDHGIDDLIQRTLLACVGARDRIRDAPNFRATRRESPSRESAVYRRRTRLCACRDESETRVETTP